MPGPLLRQNQQDRLINKIYALYDALEEVVASKDFAEYARDIMSSALQKDLTLLNAKLIKAESNPEIDDDDPDFTHEFKGYIVGSK